MKSVRLVRNYRFLFVFSILFLSICLSTQAYELKLLQPGNTAPIISLDDINGVSHSFPASNTWNFIAYWSLFCHTCIEEMPALQQKLKSSEFKQLKSFFISLDSVRMKRAVSNFLTKRNLDGTVLLEKIVSGRYLSADQWGVKMTPSIFIVSPQGVVKYSHEGPADMENMLNILRNLIKTTDSTNIANKSKIK